VNLVLFDAEELAAPLPLTDPRAQHLLKVLRRAAGDTFVAGLVNGPLGEGTLVKIGDDALTLSFAPTHEPPPLPLVTLIVGLPRPQTARDLLRDATTLGVTAIHFVATERADPNYAAATLWTSGEWRRHLLAGAAQACDTRLPAIHWSENLEAALANLPSTSCRLALDNYEATASITHALIARPGSATTLAFGPERGWGALDRAALRGAGFTLCSLGGRVLRLETAVTGALVLTHGLAAGMA
jgi:RsmE family RNA methyltransferase